MYVEPINISQKSLAPGTQKRLPADKAINLKAENVEKSVKEPDSSHVKAPDSSHVDALVKDVQKNLDFMYNIDLRFSVHKASGQIMVTVIDESTGKVIREIPPSEILNLAAKLDEMRGIIFDKKG